MRACCGLVCQCFRLAFSGGWRYYLWMTLLTVVALLGLHSYCRQFVYGVPSELYDAAKIDGAGDFPIYTRIILGMMKPILSVLAIFAFRASFNDYLWPLVAITDARKYTLPLALRGMQVTFSATEYHLVMAGSMLATLPPIIIFLILERNLVRGVALTGLKG